MRARGAILTHRALIALLVLLAFTCGVLAVGWTRDHARMVCWRDLAEEGVAPEGHCER